MFGRIFHFGSHFCMAGDKRSTTKKIKSLIRAFC
uniref:Uncharacterized protein n=1 Tax=Rhizophora mucronata TaxID=61149 RepID=A0A2P2NX77_RHIMU